MLNCKARLTIVHPHLCLFNQDRSIALTSRIVIACVQLCDVFHIGCYFLWAFVYERKKTQKNASKKANETRIDPGRTIDDTSRSYLDKLINNFFFAGI